jgi:hypothetical protein
MHVDLSFDRIRKSEATRRIIDDMPLPCIWGVVVLFHICDPEKQTLSVSSPPISSLSFFFFFLSNTLFKFLKIKKTDFNDFMGWETIGRPETLYFWVYCVGCNIPWLIIPLSIIPSLPYQLNHFHHSSCLPLCLPPCLLR